MYTFYEHMNERMTVKLTSEKEARSVLNASKKGRAAAHGDSFHRRLVILIMLRALKTHQEDNNFSHFVAVEVEKAGKFDDIMYFYASSPQDNGTLFIQAKHKQKKGSRLTQEALCNAWDSNSPYSIPMYFMSFLEIVQQLPNNSRYVLCTNALLDKSIKQYFTTKIQQEKKFLQFRNDIQATCYQCNSSKPLPKLIDTMRDACLAKLGNKLAGIVFARKIITCKDPLVYTFGDLIKACVKQLTKGSSNSSVASFTFNQRFLNAAESTPEGKIRMAFSNGYETKIGSKLDNDILRQLLIKIDKDSFTDDTNTGKIDTLAKFNRKVDEFYSKFFLVCDSLNEEELGKKELSLLPRWCDAERGTLLQNLNNLILEAMNSERPVPLDLKMIQQCFTETDLKQHIRDLKQSSKQYLESLQAKYPYVKVDPVRVPSLHAFLKEESRCGVCEFKSALDLTVSCCILTHFLSVTKHEALFIESKNYGRGKDLKDTLDDLLSYLRDVYHPTIKVTTIIGKPSDVSIEQLKELSQKYRQKIVVVEEISQNAEKGEHFVELFGEDLTADAWSKLFEQNERKLFGTTTSLSKIMDRKANLSLLLNVLQTCEHSNEMEYKNLHQDNYGKIIDWYVQREVVEIEKHETQTLGGSVNDSAFQPKGSFHTKIVDLMNVSYLTIKELFVEIRTLIRYRYEIRKLIALDEANDEPLPPVIQDGESGKVFIFLNDAGLGKSTYFIWLARRLSIYDPSLYIVKFNANEYSTDFAELKKNNVTVQNDTQVARLLYRYIHLALFVPNINNRSTRETNAYRIDADRCANLLTVTNGQIVLDEAKEKDLTTEELIELRLFRAKFNERKLVLILDGFDEIVPFYKEVVTDCFERFVRLVGVRSFYLSSRLYELKQDLLRAFDPCKFYQLKPFSWKHVVISWHKYLRSRLDGYGNYEMKHCADILCSLDRCMEKQLRRIVTVPLMLGMTQTILLPEIATRVTQHSHTITFNMLDELKLDTYQLVNRFVDMKLTLFLTDKAGTTDAAVKTAAARKIEELAIKEIKERHMLFAMNALFHEKDRSELLSVEEQKRGSDILKEVIQGHEKTGFVLGVINGVPHFTHRMFAEFFAGLWLYHNWKRFKNEPIFQSQTIWSPSMSNTLYFFESLLLNDDCDLHRQRLNESFLGADPVNCQLDNPSAITNKDQAGRLSIHIKATDSDIKMLQSISPDSINDVDELYGWNAADYAFKRNDHSVRNLDPNFDDDPFVPLIYDRLFLGRFRLIPLPFVDTIFSKILSFTRPYPKIHSLVKIFIVSGLAYLFLLFFLDDLNAVLFGKSVVFDFFFFFLFYSLICLCFSFCFISRFLYHGYWYRIFFSSR